MGYTVRRDPTGPQVTVFRVGVMDGDKVVRPPINEGDDDPAPTPAPAAISDVLWGNGPPPDMDAPENQQYDSYVDLDSGEVWVRQ